MDFVSAGKNTLSLYVIVCEKVVPRLNKHDDVIERDFMKTAPPEMKSWLRPCCNAQWRSLLTSGSLHNTAQTFHLPCIQLHATASCVGAEPLFVYM